MAEVSFTTDVPQYVLVHGAAFMDWMTFQAPWRAFDNLPFAACPLCHAVVHADFTERAGHAEWHLLTSTYREQ